MWGSTSKTNLHPKSLKMKSGARSTARDSLSSEKKTQHPLRQFTRIWNFISKISTNDTPATADSLVLHIFGLRITIQMPQTDIS